MALSLTCEHVRRAFAYWERLGFVRPRIGDTNKERAKNDLLAEESWLELFKATAPEIFVAATKRAAKAAKFWPKPFEVLEIVECLEQQVKPYYPQLPEPQRERKTPAEFVKNCGTEAKETDFYKELASRMQGRGDLGAENVLDLFSGAVADKMTGGESDA